MHQRMFKNALMALVLVGISGCSSTRENEDLKSSKIILYPVAKAGQAIGFMGQSLYSLSKPGSWSHSPSDRFPSTLSEEQRIELEKQSVFLDRSKSIEPPRSSGTGTLLFWEPIVNILARVEES